ncbi:MAG: caspase family protein, partial [Candidatus Hermodarchaeota archaeon]
MIITIRNRKLLRFSILSFFCLVFIISYIGFIEIYSPGFESEIHNTKTNPFQEESELYEDLRTSSPLPPKNAYAIVIGISDYPGSSNDLSYCDDDAQDINSMLINEYNFKTENVIYLQDSSASKNAISTAFDQISSQITSDDIFFFYYSGHGGTSIVNEGVYSYSLDSPHNYPNNYDRTWSIYHTNAAYIRVHFDHFDLEYNYDYLFLGDSDLIDDWYYEAYTGYSTGFWSGWIPLLNDHRIYIRMITDSSITKWGFSIDKYEVQTYTDEHFLCSYDSIPSTPSNYYIDTLLDSKLDALNCAEKYIVLDACNTGGMIPEVQEIGRYIMTACRNDEFSLEDPSLQHGVFTNFFLDSIDSAIDTNGDGIRSMEERFTYTYSNTVSHSGSLGYTHHPQEYDGIAGESILSTSFGSVSLNPVANELSYSFNLYGIGQIQELKVAVCNVSITTHYELLDLTLSPASNTGFGFYSGTIELNGVTGITGYGIFAEVEGNRIIHLNTTVSGDADADSLDDALEVMLGINPLGVDSDFDGLNDGLEYYGTTDPALNDTDGDLLTDGQELLTYFTDPVDPDGDDDGLLDGEEILIYLTDENNPDTDGDGMTDGYEVHNGLDPQNDDSGLDNDGDGVINLVEFQNNTDPNDPDTDDDNLFDNEEIFIYFTNATNPDTDYDNLSDDLEILTYFTDANDPDTDGDNLLDGEEIFTHFTNATNPDTDYDNLSDDLEILTYFTDANDPDTDGDNLLDGEEIFTHFTNATNP